MKQLYFPFMKGKFRHRFRKAYVCDFEYAMLGGQLLPTSLAIKNINDPEAEVEFYWLRDEDGSVLKDIKQPYEHEQDCLMIVYFAEAEC